MNSKRRFINVNYTMSYEEYDKGFTMPEFHFHNDYEIYILEHGERIVSLETEEYMTKAGDVMFFASEAPHKSRGEGAFSGICVHFSERYLRRYFTGVAIERMKEVFDIGRVHIGADELAIIKAMTDEFVIDDEYNFLKLAKVFEIFKETISCGREKVKAQQAHGVAKKSDEIFVYVEENYAKIRSVAELSEHFEVSESYLFRIFKKKYSMTLKNYINMLRVRNITVRLKYYDRSLKELAAEYGFESYEYFCRVFKKTMGVTPTEYRQNS